MGFIIAMVLWSSRLVLMYSALEGDTLCNPHCMRKIRPALGSGIKCISAAVDPARVIAYVALWQLRIHNSNETPFFRYDLLI